MTTYVIKLLKKKMAVFCMGGTHYTQKTVIEKL